MNDFFRDTVATLANPNGGPQDLQVLIGRELGDAVADVAKLESYDHKTLLETWQVRGEEITCYRDRRTTWTRNGDMFGEMKSGEYVWAVDARGPT